jgi:hypothetical protein
MWTSLNLFEVLLLFQAMLAGEPQAHVPAKDPIGILQEKVCVSPTSQVVRGAEFSCEGAAYKKARNPGSSQRPGSVTE